MSPLSLPPDTDSLQFNGSVEDYHQFSSTKSESVINTPNGSLYTISPIQTPTKNKKPNKIAKKNKSKRKIIIIVATLIFVLMIPIIIGSLVISTQEESNTVTTIKTTSTFHSNITMTAYDFTSTPNHFTCENNWMGDGVCDDETNLLECAFDYGDCCLNEIVDTNCHKCICHIDGKKHQMTTTTEMPQIQYMSLVPPIAGKKVAIFGCNILAICFYSFSVPKLLILTGQNERGNETRLIEVVDLQNPSHSCSLPEKFPKRLTKAVGGFTKDGPLLCGGDNSDIDSESKDCYTLHKSKFVKTEVNLQEERQKASAVVLPNGELWIQGGSNSIPRLKSSETISLQRSECGMELEQPNFSHCSMLINSTTVFISGGFDGGGVSKSETYFVDIYNWKSSKGPDMEEARRAHGCAVFKHNNHNYAIVAGGIVSPDQPTMTSSTEFLDLDSQILEWIKGKSQKSLDIVD